MLKSTTIFIIILSFIYKALIFAAFMYVVFELGYSAWFLVLMSIMLYFAPTYSLSITNSKEETK